MRYQRGFTLVEILVVILIISIITSVGVLSISRNENKQVETTDNGSEMSKFCIFCGSGNKSFASYCEKCGKKIS